MALKPVKENTVKNPKKSKVSKRKEGKVSKLAALRKAGEEPATWEEADVSAMKRLKK